MESGLASTPEAGSPSPGGMPVTGARRVFALPYFPLSIPDHLRYKCTQEVSTVSGPNPDRLIGIGRGGNDL